VKTDSIFYRLFLEFPRSFFELIKLPSETENNYEFTSREIKQVSFRIDGLFIPKINDPSLPFYLVEVQFQPADDLYERIFSELFLLLKQYKIINPWQVIVIYPSRNIERFQPTQFGELLQLSRVNRIYLDELGDLGNQSLGVKLVKLIIEPSQEAVSTAKQVIEEAKQILTDDKIKTNFIDLIETILVYKVPEKTREEIEAMFSLSDLKNTKFYQEAYAEGEEKGILEGVEQTKLNMISVLNQEGLTPEQIARILNLSLEIIREKIKQDSPTK